MRLSHPAICLSRVGDIRILGYKTVAIDTGNGFGSEIKVDKQIYWSSVSNADNPSNAWDVNMTNGNVNNDNQSNTNGVVLVRGGEWYIT